MYNHQLDTFLAVADAGSLSKAAEGLYISPSAVFQQIKHLEQSLDVKLLIRTNQGIMLTDAGRILYDEGHKIIRNNERLRQKLHAAEQEQLLTIHMGTGLLFKCRSIYDYWDAFHEEHPQFRLSIEDVGKGLAYFHRMSLIESVRWPDPLEESMDFLQISTTPLCLAVPRGHKYYDRDSISIAELKGETVTTIIPGISVEMDQLADEIRRSGAHIDLIEIYDHSAFSRCVLRGFLLQTPACWGDIIPDMKLLPCDRDYKLPYGFSYSRDPQSPAYQFAQFVKQRLQTCSGQKP